MCELRVAVCDDTQSEIDSLKKILREVSHSVDLFVFNSGEELLECKDGFDLYLLDIYMTGITGLEVARKIREEDEDVPIAFITISLEHTLESYRLGALKYIEKPFNTKDIQEILELALLKKRNIPALEVKKNKSVEKIPFSKIVFLEQSNHNVIIYKSNGESLKIYNKLSNIIDELDPSLFISPHKSFIVNLNYIRLVDKELSCFCMANSKNVPIRRKDFSKMKKCFEDFLFKKARGI